MIEQDILAALGPVLDLLEDLGVPYVVCGSLSSVAHGIPRSTADVDILADLQLSHAEPIAKRLEDCYYADADMIADAIKRRSSFNVIHNATIYKVDVFVSAGTEFDKSVIQRAREIASSDRPGSRRIRVQSPEDTVLSKLRWYRVGREIAERQISDVLGVLRVQSDALDREYLRRWADRLGIRDLLDRCLAEAGLSTNS